MAGEWYSEKQAARRKKAEEQYGREVGREGQLDNTAKGDGLGSEQGVMLLKGLEDGPPTGRAHTGENLGGSGMSPHLAYLTLPLPLRGESP